MMTESPAAAFDREVLELASRVVREAGLELVDLTFRGSRGGGLLRLDIDRAGPVGVSLEDCERVSRALSIALDAADPVAASYHLEVSSPGVDRPIRTADDIRRNTGRPVRVLADDPARGRQCHRGRLRGAAEGSLVLEIEDGQEVRVPLERVVRAQQDLPF